MIFKTNKKHNFKQCIIAKTNCTKKIIELYTFLQTFNQYLNTFKTMLNCHLGCLDRN